MYLHRPDLLCFAFGILFTAIGLTVLLGAGVPSAGVLLPLLAVTTGVGIAGRLLTGDVHRRAAERMARREAASAPVGAPPPPTATAAAVAGDEPVAHLPPIDDPMFGAPIHPDELDRAFRETFGDDDPATADGR